RHAMSDTAFKVEDQFVGKTPVVRAIYDRLLSEAKTLGPFDEEAKKTCIHLSNGSAFVGIHTRKAAVVITVRSDHEIKSPRIQKALRASKSRFYLDLRLEGPDEVNPELVAWLRKSYELSR